jgi:hypothetical protein
MRRQSTTVRTTDKRAAGRPGLSVLDAAEMLGISYQRMQQLAGDG